MTIIQTSELEGNALDWAVAKCMGQPDEWMADHRSGYINSASRDWRQGGPIIEQEGIAVTRTVEFWCAYRADGTHEINGQTLLKWAGKQIGPTPLVAAMRCYVEGKLGPQVDIPDELITQKPTGTQKGPSI